jgi:alpha-beta hydrolase superfamily lysophospholipase
MPSLFLVAGDDRIVDCRATRRIFGRLDSRDKKLVEFPGMFHALSIDTGREAVFEEIARWAGERF